MGYQHVNVLVPAEIYKLLREFCSKNDLKISEVVRMGIFQILGIKRPNKLKIINDNKSQECTV